MGWTFFNANGQKPADILVREYTQPMQRPDGTLQTQWRVVDHSTRGNVWYAVIETTNPDGYKRHFGAIVLFSLKNGDFGHKDMDEFYGPYAANAPIRIVDLLDKLAPLDPNAQDFGTQAAIKWRANCRANAAKPKRTYKKGMRVELANFVYVLQSKAGARRGWYVTLEGHAMQYRMTAKQLAQTIII